MKKISSFFKEIFSTNHEELTPQLVFISRFLTLMIVAYKMFPFKRKIPYWDFLTTLGPDRIYNYTLYIAVVIGVMLVLFTKNIRTGSFLIGAALLWSLISCRPCLSVANTYLSVTFIVISFSNKITGNLLLKTQILILYFCVAYNKLVEADWRNGNYFEAFMMDRHPHPLYTWASEFLKPKMLSQFMGIATICIEFSIPLCLLFKKLNKAGLIIGVLFHTILIVLTNEMFGPFYFTIVLTYFIFFTWPQQLIVHNFFLSLTKYFSWLFPHIHFIQDGGSFFVKTQNDKKNYRGYIGLSIFLFNLPVSYYLFVILSSFRNPVKCVIVLHLLMLPLYWHFIKHKKDVAV